MSTEMRLLQGLRNALSTVAGNDDAAARNYALTSAQVLVEELMLRADSEWYARYIERGELLLRDARLIVDTPADADAAFSEAEQQIEELRRRFAAMTPTLITRRAPGDTQLLSRLLAWEGELYTRGAAFESAPTATVAMPTRDELQRYLRTRFPQQANLEVTGFRALHGGLQKLTILFETSQPICGAQSLVMRAEQPDRFLALDIGSVVDEYDIVRFVFEAGIPAAEPLWCESDPAPLGRRFLVSRRAAGINYGSAVGVDSMPAEVARAFVDLLVQLHSLPVARYRERLSKTPLARWFAFDSLPANTLANVHYMRGMLDRVPHSASPALEAVCAWLIANVPQTAATACLLHCDYGPHNALVEGHRVTALLDWESARIGDPAEDLAFYLERTAGKVDREEAIRWYEEAGGQRIDEFRLRYFELFSLLKVFIACLASNALYMSDATARNEMVPLAFRLMHWPVGIAAARIEAADRARRK
jgi:aminoglycoside phosphotransferase (APT) family kinase protein